MIARTYVVSLFAALMLIWGGALHSPAAAADDDDLTVESIVKKTIVGHAEDGYYLDFKPFGVVELPRIFLISTEDGGYTVDMYGSTKSALQSGAYGLVPPEAKTMITDEQELQEAFASKNHLYGKVQYAGTGTIAVDFSISRHLIFGLLSMAIVLGIFLSLAQKYKRGVGRNEAPHGVLQNMMEVMVVFLRDEVAKPNIGEKYEKFLPFLLTAFFFILVSNILGLVPFSGAATSNIAVTVVLALMTFGIGLIYGSKDHYKHLLLGPPDAPLVIRVILVPIEVMGLVTRHVALAIRLFANMMGGSLIIFSLIGLVFIMNLLFGQVAAFGAGIISTGFTVFVLLLKLLVAFIQAYVFTMLSALFIGMSVEEHHDHDHHDAAHDGHDAAAVTPTVGGNGMAEERTRVDSSEVGEPVTAS